jgi:hypothetical protein
MALAVRYEQTAGRQPEDVSARNLGFDLLSSGDGVEYRRIEVKGLAGTGSVMITENEMNAASKHKDTYWLYVVENCASSTQRIYTINGISATDADCHPTEYIIDVAQQASHGIEVE